VAKGIDLFKILQAACINPVHHYKMKVGLLNEGDAADLIVVKDLKTFEVLQTYIDGKLVAENGRSKIESARTGIINRFDCDPIKSDDLYISRPAKQQIHIIGALDGQLITNKYSQDVDPLVGEDADELAGNIDIDILKIVVVNRYIHSKVAVAFIKNFGLKSGAFASSVAHDSHNIVAVGINDESIRDAVNMIIEHRGGVSFISDDIEMIVPLPVAGLMSNEDGYKVAEQYSLIDKAVKDAGCSLSAPFMTLSFMALLVIPHLKLSDLGLFDGDKFEFVK
jgi:adenine deaminase